MQILLRYFICAFVCVCFFLLEHPLTDILTLKPFAANFLISLKIYYHCLSHVFSLPQIK